MNAIQIINAALTAMMVLDQCEYPLAEGYWDIGEPEKYLLLIAEGSFLSYIIDGGKCYPCLR